MEFVKKLRGKSVLGSLFLALMPLLFGVVFLIGGDLKLLLQKPRDLYDVPQDELEGAYVTVEMPFLYGVYAYEEEYENNRATGKIMSVEYVIDANELSFCGLYVSGSDIKKADALMEQCYAFAEGTGGVTDQSLTVTGVMKAMHGDSLRFYKEYVEYDDMSPEDQALFLPLYLDTSVGVNWTMMVIGLLLAAGGVWIIAYAASGKYQKNLMESAAALSGGNPEYILEQAAQLRETEPVCKGLWVGTNLVYMEQGMRQFVYDRKDVCWAYPEVTRQRLYGIITVAKHHALVLRTMDGKKFAYSMSEKKVHEVLETIGKLLPGCVTGYSEQLEALYNQDRAKFAQIAALRSAQQ